MLHRFFLCSLLVFAGISIVTPAPISAQDSALTLNTAGEAYMAQERYYAAVEQFKASLAKNPTFARPMIGLSEAFFYLGEYEEAFRWINQAVKYEKANVGVIVLSGRIENALGRADKAKELFNSVLLKEPNNVDAWFGLAEVSLSAGKPREAATLYEKALTLSPVNRKALLSLSVLYNAEGFPDRAEEKLRLALRYYTDNPQVHLFAARHFLKKASFPEAEKHVTAALTLKNNYPDAELFYGNLLAQKGDFSNAATVLTNLLKKEPSNHLVRYALGRVFEELGDYDKSILNYSQAFAARPDDEISRISLEELIKASPELPDTIRKQYAEYHLVLGAEYERRNLFTSAVYEYRRGLSIHPSSVELRYAYAKLINKIGFPAKYLSELKVLIEDIQASGRALKDEYEIQKSLQEDGLSQQWGVDQFLLRRHAYRIRLFHDYNGTGLKHFGAEKSLASMFLGLLLHFENIAVPVAPPEKTKDFAEAYRRAREGGSDYFVILRFSENDRAFQVSASMYHSGTGNKVRDFSVLRTGNNRTSSALRKLSEDVHGSLEIQGWIVERRFEKALVNLGTYDGIKTGDEFYIFRKGGVRLFQDKLGLFLDTKNLLGTLTITEADELISEGTIQTDQFFDMINPGDEIVGKSEERELPPEVVGLPADTLREILIIK